MEKIHWRHYSSQAKVIGTIASMTGAFVVILYKGPSIFKMHSSTSYNTLQFSPNFNWILGGLLSAGDSLLSSIWYIYQVVIIMSYTSLHFTSIFWLMCFFFHVKLLILFLLFFLGFSNKEIPYCNSDSLLSSIIHHNSVWSICFNCG